MFILDFLSFVNLYLSSVFYQEKVVRTMLVRTLRHNAKFKLAQNKFHGQLAR